MSRELRHVLISAVLLIAIWAVTIALPGSDLHWLLVIGTILAALDLMRALWALFQASVAPDEEEEELP